MTPIPSTPPGVGGRRWFVDEDLRGLALVLERPGLNVVYPDHPACPDIVRGDRDEDWIPIVAAGEWPILTHNNEMKRHPTQRALLDQHRAIVFFLRAKDASTWEQVRLVARYWDDINASANKALKGGHRRFSITRNGVQSL